MDKILIELNKISEELSLLKSKLDSYEAERNFENWIPRKKLMEFLKYGDTQMAALLNSGKLKVALIGNRKFIKKESVISLLENNTK